MKRAQTLAALALACFLTACSADNTGANNAVEVLAEPQERAQTAPQLPLPPPIRGPEEPQEPIILINDGAGILNGDFTEYLDQFPYWESAHGLVKLSPTAGPDESAAAMFPARYTYEYLRQKVSFSEPPAGRSLTFSAMARCPEPDKAKVTIELPDGTVVQSPLHPGDDSWTELSVTAEFPEGFTATHVLVYLAHTGSPTQPAYFDKATLTLE